MTPIRTAALVSSAIGLIALARPAVAQDATGQASSDQNDATAGSSPDVIVTAQRREQTLFKVPQSISVIGGETLERQQATSFEDFAKLAPGLSLQQSTPGDTRLILRGVNAGSVGAAVAVYADDVPFGQSGSLANGGLHAGDFDTFDIARVEVLKGPQGTLYGSNSLGGVLKFITNAPALDRFEGRGQAGIEGTRDGGTGYSGNAMLNVPLGSTVAVRASGFYRRYAGYIDTTGRPGNDVNRVDSYGGRATLLFKPSEDFNIRLFGLIQNLDVDSPSSFTADPATLRPASALTGQAQGTHRTRFELYPESNPSRYRIYSGTLNWNLGFGTLTSVTSYQRERNNSITDITTNAARGLTALVPQYVTAAGSASNIGLGFQSDVALKKFTQEVRLASPTSTVFDYVIGGYYTHEDTTLFQRYFPFNIANRTLIPPAGSLPALGVASFQEFVTAQITDTYKEIAGFATGTLHLGPRFDITAGGRYSHNSQNSVQNVLQFGAGPTTFGKSKQSVFTWSIAPRFEINDRASLYARVAKGYRPGGPTFIPAGAPADYPKQFNSDTLVSYEAGFRAETPDRKFGIDLSGYYVDWKDILIIGQVQTSAGPATVNTNGRRARTYGAEASATLRPTTGLTFVGSVTYNHARLRDDTTAQTGGANIVGGLAGDPLPYSPKIAASASVDYEWRLGDTTTAFVGGDVAVTGDQFDFSAAYRTAYGHLIRIDGYTTTDLRAGVNLGGITVSAYAKNLFNAYAITNVTYGPTTVPASLGGAGVPQALVSTIRPRTIGATVGFKF